MSHAAELIPIAKVGSVVEYVEPREGEKAVVRPALVLHRHLRISGQSVGEQLDLVCVEQERWQGPGGHGATLRFRFAVPHRDDNRTIGGKITEPHWRHLRSA